MRRKRLVERRVEEQPIRSLTTEELFLAGQRGQTVCTSRPEPVTLDTLDARVARGAWRRRRRDVVDGG